MRRDQSASHLQKTSGFPLLLYRAVNYSKIPSFKLENGSRQRKKLQPLQPEQNAAHDVAPVERYKGN